jgi:hypothetical protein
VTTASAYRVQPGAPWAGSRRAGWRIPLRALPAAVVAVVGCLLWLWHTPPVGDLAAQTGWAQLAERAGDVPWFTRWYAGVPVGGYSLTTPPLMALIGVRTVGVLATLASAAIAVPLLRDARRPALGAAFFALTAVADMYSGRITFAAGGAVAMAAVLALERHRTWAAALLAALATVTSPVAGLFLAIPLAVYFVADRGRRRSAFIVGVVTAVVGVAVSVLFPVGGLEPFAFFVFRPAVEIPIVAALLPVGRRVRLGLVFGAVVIAASYYVHSPVGSNSTRLALLVAVPVLVAACRLPALLLAPFVVILGLWPWHQLHDDQVAARDPSAQTSFTAGLVNRLQADPVVRSERVEVVQPRTHWAETRLADHGVTLARGWVRQVDEGRNPLFYGRSQLDAASYRTWLDTHSVAYVAVPKGTPIDFGSGAEASLVNRELPYLQRVWSDAHWDLYAVSNPAPVATGVAQVTQLTDTGARLQGAGPGEVTLTMRWSPWFTVDGGSVHKDGNNIRLTLTRGGAHYLHAVWRFP